MCCSLPSGSKESKTCCRENSYWSKSANLVDNRISRLPNTAEYDNYCTCEKWLILQQWSLWLTSFFFVYFVIGWSCFWKLLACVMCPADMKNKLYQVLILINEVAPILIIVQLDSASLHTILYNSWINRSVWIQCSSSYDCTFSQISH